MTQNNPVENMQKISRVWSREHERQISVRIHYQKEEMNGCKIYRLGQVEQLD